MTSDRRWRPPVSALVLTLVGLAAGCGAPVEDRVAAPEVTEPAAYDGPSLVDVTRELGLDFSHVASDTDVFRFPDIMAGGAALFDYDGDGDLDAYFTNGSDDPTDPRGRNVLFRQESDGTFEDVSEESGLDDPGYGMGVAIGDFDNDGDPDVYLTQYGYDRLYLNRGDGSFQDATTPAGIEVGGWSCSATFFDYDLDGFLDLWVTRYVRDEPRKLCPDSAGRPNYCGPDSFAPEFDVLLHNRGDGTFEDVSARAGIRESAGAGLGVVVEDFDGDGWPDVYVTNDGYANHFWINRGDGTFRDDALLLGAALDLHGRAEAGMGVLAADLDNDLDIDLFMTHLSNETNTFYRNRGAGIGFDDASGQSGLGAGSLTSTGFGTAALDLDLDGDLDLLVVNGRVSRDDPRPEADVGPHWNLFAEPNSTFLNRGDGSFESVGTDFVAFTEPTEVSRALAVGDIDDDGDLDFVVANLGSPARLYRNETSRTGHWLEVRAVDPRYSRDAIGASVTLLGDGVRIRRTVHRGFSYLSSSDPRAHFGIADGTTIARVVVRWPDGLTESFPVPGLDRELRVERGAGTTLPDSHSEDLASVESRTEAPASTARRIPPVLDEPRTAVRAPTPDLSTPPEPDLTGVDSGVVARIEALRAAIRSTPESAEPWGELGAAFDIHGLFGPAADCYRRAHRLAPDEFRWAYLLAVVRDVDGASDDEIATLFAEATRLDPDYVPAWFRLGHALSLRGRFGAARDALLQALTIDPDLAVANREMGQVALAMGNAEEALTYLSRAEELSPSDSAVYSALARTYNQLGQTDRARVAAERAATLAPRNDLRDPIYARAVASGGVSTRHLLERAEAQLAAGDPDGALETLAPLELDDGIEGDVLIAHGYYLSGTARARLQQAERARALLTRALELDPEHVGAHLELAAIDASQGRVEQALQGYREAYRFEPDDAVVLAGLAQLLAMTGDDEGAVATYDRLAKIAPLDARTLTNWGNALMRTQYLDDAIVRYREALKVDPGFANAHYNLAVTLERSGARLEAVNHYRATLRIDPRHRAAAAAVRRLDR